MGLGGQPNSQVVTTQGRYFLPGSAPTKTIARSGSAVTPVTAPSTGPAPVEVPPASSAPGVPLLGQATASGCAAALAYLDAYAAPGFTLECPASSRGHEASTSCISQDSPCDEQRVITIADPCPAAYMNEASNSWVLLGESTAPIDPYGQCP
jgi:hypothetical protein